MKLEGDFIALRMDDIGAASKVHEVYGSTRVSLCRFSVPFPGNWLFFKYLKPFKKWGPYPELDEKQWEQILSLLDNYQAKLTIGITATWVEANGLLIPFPQKFPKQAALLKEGVQRGFIEIANHGLTHCVLQRKAFRPRLFSSNRWAHREFLPGLPQKIHEEHLQQSQEILQKYFQVPVVTFIPPGNVFTLQTVRAAQKYGIQYISCNAQTRMEEGRITFIADQHLITFHDRDIILKGVEWLERLLRQLQQRKVRILFVREIGERLRDGSTESS
jgi:peptidoglycan/xylan/chitin deacetylase (PgdA/CDA1 family)